MLNTQPLRIIPSYTNLKSSQTTMLNQSVTVKFDFVYFLFEIILSVTALSVETGNENMWSIQKFVFSFSDLVFWLENQIITQRKYILRI